MQTIYSFYQGGDSDISKSEKELLKQINSILKCFVKIDKQSAAEKAGKNIKKRTSKTKSVKEKSVKEMNDKEFLDYFRALPSDCLMPAEEMKKMIRESRTFDVTRKINYPEYEVSD